MEWKTLYGVNCVQVVLSRKSDQDWIFYDIYVVLDHLRLLIVSIEQEK